MVNVEFVKFEIIKTVLGKTLFKLAIQSLPMYSLWIKDEFRI